MTNRIYEEIAKKGTIVPVPLIVLAVAIAFSAVVVGCLVEIAEKWVMSWGG